MKSIIAALLLATVGRAAVIPIAPSDFNNSSSILFDGLATGIEANGLVVGGVTFAVTLNGLLTNGLVTVDGGPGVTNNINPPNLVSIIGNSQPTLTVMLPGFSTQFGYGFALLADGTLANATTIELFSGTTSVGSLGYAAAPDPSFPGGFAGIESTLPFDRAVISFSPTATSFAVDNFIFNHIGVPESGSTLEVLVIALVLLAGLRRYWDDLTGGLICSKTGAGVASGSCRSESHYRKLRSRFNARSSNSKYSAREISTAPN